ncbi:glycosyltransferase [Aquibium oceanicum]|uniref:Glycosyl transferase family 2 n=1 Tax=Aquibium oceanicum TaxID=1670800 RepID=A0A1L3SPB0_9HYPH|nr:glycosyltransferase [Aquibium oceanicum]APH71175.1 glycosyl transferase family 2 [Aquibium oceanicum]
MLTVLIETRNDEDALARTLMSLVSGAVEGVVREVLVHDRGSTDHTKAVADHAGCALIPNGELAAGMRCAKGDWLLFMEPGAKLTDGWIDAVVAHVGRRTTPGRFLRSRSSDAWFPSRWFSRRRPLAEGLLVSKPQALAKLRPGDEVDAFARRISGQRIGAEIIPAEIKQNRRRISEIG